MKGQFLTVEKENKVLDIQSAQDKENRNILVWAKHGGTNQQWEIVYADENRMWSATHINMWTMKHKYI